MSTPLPPRLSHFGDPIGDVVWAAVSALSPGDQQALYARLRDHLGDRLLTTSQASGRVHRAIEGLRRAAELLGHSPSIKEYRRLRGEHPDDRLPADSSVRSALGSGTWNDCLRVARLDSVADGDLMVMTPGPKLTAAECSAALRACAEDLGTVPTANGYCRWAARPDVKRRTGRRPLGLNSIVRLFGNFTNGLIAAGLIDGETSTVKLVNGVIRVRGWRASDEEIAAALSEVCERIGHIPRSTEYAHVRELIIDESAAAGKPRTIPAVVTVMRRYGTWSSTLAAFGLEPFESRSSVKPSAPIDRSWRYKRFTEDEMLAAVREASRGGRREGTRLTFPGYELWRKGEVERSRREDEVVRRLPSAQTIRNHMGNWARVRELAFGTTS